MVQEYADKAAVNAVFASGDNLGKGKWGKSGNVDKLLTGWG